MFPNEINREMGNCVNPSVDSIHSHESEKQFTEDCASFSTDKASPIDDVKCEKSSCVCKDITLKLLRNGNELKYIQQTRKKFIEDQPGFHEKFLHDVLSACNRVELLEDALENSQKVNIKQQSYIGSLKSEVISLKSAQFIDKMKIRQLKNQIRADQDLINVKTKKLLMLEQQKVSDAEDQGINEKSILL